MEMIADVPVSELIGQLAAAGIDPSPSHEWASRPGSSLQTGETPHTEATARPRREFPDVGRLRTRRVRRPHVTTDPYFDLGPESEVEASDIGSLGTPDPSVVDISEEIPEVTQEATRDDAPKLKKAKNKISPSTSSRYAHLFTDSDEEGTPEEQVNEEYLKMLHESHLQYEKEVARKKRSFPSFAADKIPEVPAEATALFQDFEKKTLDQKVQ